MEHGLLLVLVAAEKRLPKEIYYTHIDILDNDLVSLFCKDQVIWLLQEWMDVGISF